MSGPARRARPRSSSRSPEALAAQGAAYLALMLERAPGATAHDQCAEGHPQRFFRTRPKDRPRVEAKALEMLMGELERLGAGGARLAIWSDEAFLARPDRVAWILRRARASGVRPVAHMRRHDGWARSGSCSSASGTSPIRGPCAPSAPGWLARIWPMPAIWSAGARPFRKRRSTTTTPSGTRPRICCPAPGSQGSRRCAPTAGRRPRCWPHGRSSTAARRGRGCRRASSAWRGGSG